MEQTASAAVAVRYIFFRPLMKFELVVFFCTSVCLYYLHNLCIYNLSIPRLSHPLPHQTSLSERAAHESEKQELEMTVENLQFEKQEMKNSLDRSYRDIDRLNDSAEMTREDTDLQVNVESKH